MSDYGNILDHLEACKNAWANKDYIGAAIDAFWCIQYCQYGEPYGMSSSELYSSESQAYGIYRKALTKLKGCKLSKTTFVYGTICPKLLWLYKYKYDLRMISESTQKKFDAGHNIGYLAQSLFPNGTDASAFDSECIIDMTRISLPFNLKQQQWIARTQKSYKEKTVYEAAFTFDEVFAAVDILDKTEVGHIAYEVKCSQAITETFLKDCALQYYVISKNCKLDDFFLIYVNKDYLEEVNIPMDKMNASNVDIHRLFKIESVLSKILPMQDYISEKIKTCKSIIRKGEPAVATGMQCDNPYECMFKHYCCHNSHEDSCIK